MVEQKLHFRACSVKNIILSCYVGAREISVIERFYRNVHLNNNPHEQAGEQALWNFLAPILKDRRFNPHVKQS